MGIPSLFALTFARGARFVILAIALLAGGAAVAWMAPAHDTILPDPAQIPNGATVTLRCGVTYQGTLDLTGKTGVTVRTGGSCGKARISPGRAITGWVRYQGNIYSAPIDFTPEQISIDGAALSAAHWPNQPWAHGRTVPSGDLAGATMVVLANQSVVQTRKLESDRIDPSGPFYVEGKLWMLDSPGEWAAVQGRLYVWAHDGRSPEGRAWAAPDANGIRADHSSGILIAGVVIFSAHDGISADGAVNLKIIDTEIIDSHRDGIWASGSRGLLVRGTTVARARRNGIDGWYAVSDAVIQDSRVIDTGMVGMPTPSDGAIMFGAGTGNRIDNVRVANSAYHGINVMRNRHASVRNSVVDRSCRRLTDCGGIYTAARNRQPLDLVIAGNTVTNTTGPDTIGIYLDDFANGVTVEQNTVTGNQRGLVIHDGFDNIVRNNLFAASRVLHLGLAQDAGRIHAVQITGNVFRSTGGEQTFNLEGGPNFRDFATFDHNTYISNDWAVFGKTWDGRSAGVASGYDAWKKLMQQDIHSRTVDAATAHQEEGSFTAP